MNLSSRTKILINYDYEIINREDLTVKQIERTEKDMLETINSIVDEDEKSRILAVHAISKIMRGKNA